MTAREFQEFGLLQEVNRRFLHPMGLALEIIVEEDGSARFGEVWDYRDDPEGIIFSDLSDVGSRTRAERVANLQRQMADTRRQRLGYVVQRIGSKA